MKFRDIFAVVALAYVLAILAFVHIGHVKPEHWHPTPAEHNAIEILKAVE